MTDKEFPDMVRKFRNGHYIVETRLNDKCIGVVSVEGANADEFFPVAEAQLCIACGEEPE